MRELNLDRLRTLVAVADLRGFAAASRALHLAPPTVTQHVAELESRLGAPLLVRGRDGATPTAVGTTLIERARRLLADADDLVEAVRAQIDGRRGRVRLGASTGALARVLPLALERLARGHAGIDVQVAVLTSSDTMARLAAGALELGIVALPQPPVPGVRVVPWRRDPIRAFVPSVWQPPRTVSPAWLAARPLILNDAGTRLSQQVADWFAHAGLRPRARTELNFNDSIRSLVAAGYGASLLPDEPGVTTPDPRVAVRGLRPALWRPLGLATRDGAADGTTAVVVQVLRSLGESAR